MTAYFLREAGFAACVAKLAVGDSGNAAGLDRLTRSPETQAHLAV